MPTKTVQDYIGSPSTSFNIQPSYPMKQQTLQDLRDDEEFANNLRKVQSLGYAALSNKTAKISKDQIQDPSYFRHSSLGWNYRMPELCCAVAYAQVVRLEELVNIRKLNYIIFL